MQIPETPRALAARTALECVGLQESRLARQWSEAVVGRWPRVRRKKWRRSRPGPLPSGGWMSDLLKACTPSLNPYWCCFPLCGTEITHCTYGLSLTSTFHFPPLWRCHFVLFQTQFSCKQPTARLSEEAWKYGSCESRGKAWGTKIEHDSPNFEPIKYRSLYDSDSVRA